MNNAFKQTRRRLLINYAISAAIAFSPLILPIIMMIRSSQRPFLKVLHIGIILPTILLMPLSLTLGIVGAICNTIWGAIALPIALFKDHRADKHEERQRLMFITQSFSHRALIPDSFSHWPLMPKNYINTLQTSTLRIQHSLNRDPNDDPALHAAITASLQESNNSRQASVIPEKNPVEHSIYSVHTQNYLISLKDRATIKEQIELLSEQLEEMGDAFTQNELDQLEDFKDPISMEYFDIPILPHETYFDLNTTLKLTANPFNREPFTPLETQSAGKLLEQFQEFITSVKIRLSRLSEASSQSSNVTL